jgi:hypothetical protein
MYPQFILVFKDQLPEAGGTVSVLAGGTEPSLLEGTSGAIALPKSSTSSQTTAAAAILTSKITRTGLPSRPCRASRGLTCFMKQHLPFWTLLQ